MNAFECAHMENKCTAYYTHTHTHTYTGKQTSAFDKPLYALPFMQRAIRSQHCLRGCSFCFHLHTHIHIYVCPHANVCMFTCMLQMCNQTEKVGRSIYTKTPLTNNARRCLITINSNNNNNSAKSLHT